MPPQAFYGVFFAVRGNVQCFSASPETAGCTFGNCQSVRRNRRFIPTRHYGAGENLPIVSGISGIRCPCTLLFLEYPRALPQVCR